MAKNEVTPTFFETPQDFRIWLRANHDRAGELWVGFHKKSSGRPSMTWPESVDEALCVGWIDGLRKRIDESSYMIRFTPRLTNSTWSAVNIGRVAELTKQKRMRAAGVRAFARRSEKRSGIYAYEQRQTAAFDPVAEERFRANAKAWAFFQAQPAWYRRTATWWTISAKKEETREKRLAQLISDSAAGVSIRELRRIPK